MAIINAMDVQKIIISSHSFKPDISKSEFILGSQSIIGLGRIITILFV